MTQTDATLDKQRPWGVLLVNLGTPDAPTPQALRRYLKQFLSDRRVVDLPRVVWWPILNLILLNTRPKRSAKLYEAIWTDGGSPLLVTSKVQRDALAAELQDRWGKAIPVALGMRYGNPSMQEGLERLRDQGCEQVVVLPLFPQYSTATTASVGDVLSQRGSASPETVMVNNYHDHPGYIAALAASVRQVWLKGGEPERLIISFHGTPERYRSQGDPYFDQCETTARLLAKTLVLPKERWLMTFQSRFGPEDWLKPYTDTTLESWAAEGIKRVDVVCPGFAADCLETLEEIAVTNHDWFIEAGGETLRYIPALNRRGDHIATLADLVLAQPR